MIFNDEVLYIHIGKTGGKSCAEYLLRNLKTPVYNCHETADREIIRLQLEGVIPCTDTNRHWTLSESLDYIKVKTGKSICEFKKILAVVRHPFSLEYSFYRHLQKPRVRAHRANTDPLLVHLADGSFEQFVRWSGYHVAHTRQEDFLTWDNKMPEILDVIKFEELTEKFPAAVAPFFKTDVIEEFPHLNRTDYDELLKDFLTDDVKAALYRKHRFMFDSGLYALEGVSINHLDAA